MPAGSLPRPRTGEGPSQFLERRTRGRHGLARSPQPLLSRVRGSSLRGHVGLQLRALPRARVANRPQPPDVRTEQRQLVQQAAR